MRKTVQEWLESHQNGAGMGKKRRGDKSREVGVRRTKLKKVVRKKRKPR